MALPSPPSLQVLASRATLDWLHSHVRRGTKKLSRRVYTAARAFWIQCPCNMDSGWKVLAYGAQTVARLKDQYFDAALRVNQREREIRRLRSKVAKWKSRARYQIPPSSPPYEYIPTSPLQ